jgi:hypothetical protein
LRSHLYPKVADGGLPRRHSKRLLKFVKITSSIG